MPADLRSLLKKEQRVSTTLQTVVKFVDGYKQETDGDQVEVRLQLLETVYEDFKEVREKIEVIMEEIDESVEVDPKECDEARAARLETLSKAREAENAKIAEDVANCYCRTKAALMRFRRKIQPDQPVPQPAQPTGPTLSKVKLPEIKLPTFSGKLRDWVSYRDAFRSLIHQNQALTEMDKFTYLRSSLSGEALQEVSSIELSAVNYDVAWKALEARYHNKKLIVKAYLDAIFEIESMRKENYESLSQLISDFEKNLQMLDKMGETTGDWSTILVHMVCSRFDSVTLRLWETNHNSKDVPTYTNLMTFLKNHCAVLQSVGAGKPTQSELKRPRVSVSHPSTANQCSFCSESFHPVFVCKRFQKMKLSERYDAVRKNGLCMNCLSSGHLARTCTKGSCRQCGRKHHTLLHPSTETNSATQKPSVPQTTNRPPSENQPQTRQSQPRPQTQNTAHATQTIESSTSMPIVNTQSHSTRSQLTPVPSTSTQHTVALPTHTQAVKRQVLLSTALIRVSDDFGNTIFARALLDSCSQYCFVTSDFCRRMKLEEFPDVLLVKGIGESGTMSKKAVYATVSPRYAEISDFDEVIQFNVLPKLTIPLPYEGFEIAHWNIPEQILLADPYFYQPAEIDMIIGAEYFLDLLRDGRVKLTDEGPTLQNTAFGWIVSGRVPTLVSPNTPVASYICSTADLQDQLTRFWELETCHVKSTNSVEESMCEEIFKQTVTRDENGRFLVTLPKKDFVLKRLGDSKNNALKRFQSLEKRFAVNPQLKELYCDFIKEYADMGHMQEITEDSSDTTSYYLPHHAVLKPDSTTTKLRVVFDASCRTSSGVSLNDGLLVGPVVQDDLMSIITRFRLHRLALVADIAKMYRMINVVQSDQSLQRILWRDSPSQPIRTFQLTTVTYGTASAPFLATRCLQQLAMDGETTHPTAARVVRKDFYVDDMITGVDDVEEGKTLVKEMVDLMTSACLTLRKWNSNCGEILDELPPQLRDDRTVCELDSPNTTVKTLGLAWKPADDCFCFTVPKWNETAAVTKRTVLSDASKLFDPLGLVGPVIVQAKIFIQMLWKLDCKWDEPLPEDLRTFWDEYRRNLIALEPITIPRWVGFSNKCVNVEWHGFCDASVKAYGACLYLRSTFADGTVRVELMMSKSRVAPLEDLKKKKRKESIPRLELSSALLLSHLFDKVKRSTSVAGRAYFWTDSTIVCCWLASVPSRWQAFVANRVSEIQHLTKDGVWNHVPGVENPADVLSRGVMPVQLQYQSSWFHGPVWLHQEPSYWPKDCDVSTEQFESAVLEERSAVALPLQAVPPSDIFSIRSSLPKLVRIVALILRFRHNAQRQNRNARRLGFITSLEYDNTLKYLVKLSQKECFPEDLKQLGRGGQVKDSSRLHALNPQLMDGIMCVGGRLSNAPVPEGRKHPMILDNHHPLATLIVRHQHRKLFHAGQQALIANIRGRFWIIHIRTLVRKVLHSCIDCFRAKPRTQDQLMADLPPVRVTPAPAFLKVGVDYCGPFQVTYPTRPRPPSKCFVVVFVCLVTKAVHIELASDLSTEAFLAALRCFTGRRGYPALIMCDNGRNFVGANRELRELRRLFLNQQFQDQVIRETAPEGIDFQFIPARSPNFGGLWEAAVKCVKIALKKTIGTDILLYFQMYTVLVQVEAMLNSRPLTPISNDPGDFEVLTPGHFIVQRPLTAIPEPNVTKIPKNRLTIWQQIQAYSQMVWQKWTTLYLSDLHNRTKWTKKRDNVAVGTMVLLMDERLPPLMWCLGRITEIFRGTDDNIRVVNVRTKDGTYRRSISKICVLPTEDNAELTNGES